MFEVAVPRSLYAQVLVAVVVGVLVGALYPATGEAMKPLGDGFIKLVKMMIAPIIFCTVVLGIAGMEDMKKVGKTGGLALALLRGRQHASRCSSGWWSSTSCSPGAGMNADPATLDAAAVAAVRRGQAGPHGVAEFLLDIIPTTVVGAFASGDILQVLLFSVLFGFALHAARRARARRAPVSSSAIGTCCSRIVGIIMRLAPIGAFGAMAFTIGKYGVGALRVARQADGVLLRDLPAVHLRRARRRSRACTASASGASSLHPGGAVHRARHVVVGVGAAADDGQARGARRREVRRRPRDPDRLLVQPRRHGDLPDDGGGVHRAGDQHAARPRRSSSRCSRCCCSRRRARPA